MILKTTPRPALPPAQRWLVGAAAGCTILLGACASNGEAPVANLAVARTSITQAEAVDAPQLAPVEYRNARDKLIRAQEAMQGKRYADARQLADESAADADVAERKARAVKSLDAAQALQRSNAVLRSELNRTTETTTQTVVVPDPAAGSVSGSTRTTTTITTHP